jgi:hypothetical protein
MREQEGIREGGLCHLEQATILRLVYVVFELLKLYLDHLSGVLGNFWRSQLIFAFVVIFGSFIIFKHYINYINILKYCALYGDR